MDKQVTEMQCPDCKRVYFDYVELKDDPKRLAIGRQFLVRSRAAMGRRKAF